jgi:hypothetical protein
MNFINKSIVFIFLAGLASLSLGACGGSKPEATPTIDLNAFQTEVVSTFEAGLTQTALLQPTKTPTYTPTSTATVTPTLRATHTPGSGIVPTISCYHLVLDSDVTIPDHAPKAPGQTFIKTWRVRNNGSCAWEKGFKFIFISGDAMGGTTQVLDEVVNPGEQTDISIDMTAPNKTGSVQGNWQMSTADGIVFNDVVWVIIDISGATSTITPTVSATPTSTNTETSTPTSTPETPEPSS